MSSGKDDGTGFKELNLGLGGLLKGFGELINIVHNMAEEGKDTYTKSGDILGQHNGQGVQGKYGLTIRLGAGEDVKFDQLADRAGDEVFNLDTVVEPLGDVYDEGEFLVVVVEIPGVTEEVIAIDVTAETLNLNAQGVGRQYRKMIKLPAPVEKIPQATSYINGILQLKFKKQMG